MVAFTRKKFSIVFLISSISLGCFFPFAHAQLEHEIAPLVYLQEQYDSNIYLANSFREGDVISTISPGFSLLLSHPRFKLSCTYLHDFVYFRDNPQLDYKGHNLNFNLETQATEHLKFLFTEIYIRSNDPEFTVFPGTDVQQTGTGFRRLYNQNVVSPQLEYQFGKEDFVNFFYRNTRYTQEGSIDNYTDDFVNGLLTYWFNENNGINLQYSHDIGNFETREDFTGDRIAPRLIYRFSPQTEVFADYSYSQTDYDHKTVFINNMSPLQKIFFPRYVGTNFNQQPDINPDYFVNEFAAGFKSQPYATLNVEGKLGYYWRNGHNSTDNQGFIYRLFGEKQFSSATVFMDYRGGYTENYFGIRDSGFYEFWGIGTGFTYYYENVLTFRADGSFSNADYAQDPIAAGLQNISQRKDDVWQGNILMGYNITPFLTFELEYNYLDQASNRKTNSYIDNRLTGRLVINFQKKYQKGFNEQKKQGTGSNGL